MSSDTYLRLQIGAMTALYQGFTQAPTRLAGVFAPVGMPLREFEEGVRRILSEETDKIPRGTDEALFQKLLVNAAAPRIVEFARPDLIDWRPPPPPKGR